MRMAFIRITCHNETEDGVIDYTRVEWENALIEWKNDAPNMLAYWSLNEHSAGKPDAHIHILLKFNNPVPFERLKRSIPYGSIQNPHNYKAAMQYLIHLNNPEKEQFVKGWDAITTNYESLDQFKPITKSQEIIDLYRLAEKIDSGDIREFNLHPSISMQLWYNNKYKIIAMLEHYREKVLMDKDRQISVVFFGGETDTGKTTFAKEMCKQRGWSFDISSSSNDPFQDYKGQDVLILDDMRDTAFSIEDLIKILDNHTKSTSKSRYHNKAFIGHLIIITSNISLDHWYVLSKEKDKSALFRRISQVYEFCPDVIYRLEYNKNSDNWFPYEHVDYIVNPLFEYKQRMENPLFNAFKAVGKEAIKIKGSLIKDLKE